MSELDEQALAKKVNLIRILWEGNSDYHIKVELEGIFYVFRCYITENSPKPFIVKRAHKDVIADMDLAMATLLLMNTIGTND